MIYSRFRRQLPPMLASIFVSVCLLLSACGLKSGRSSAEAEEVHKQIMELRHKGEAARKSSRFDEAIRLHREELELATSIGDTISIVRTLNNIGTNYRRLGMLEEATRYHQDALVMTMNCTDQNDEEIKKTKLMSLNGLGNVYLTLGDLKQAEVIFRQALEGEKVIGSKIGQAINLANIGAVKEKQGQADSAWVYYRYSLALNKQAQSKLGEALCFSHFGSLHEASGKFEDALEEYKHAYEVMADSPDDWHKLEAGVNIAKLYIRLGDYQRAQQYLKDADDTACRIHSLAHRSSIHELYYQLYDKKGDVRAALDHHVLYTQLRDSLVDDGKLTEIQKMRISLEREQNKDQLKMLDELYKTERWALRLITLLLSLALLAAITVIILLRRKLYNKQ